MTNAQAKLWWQVVMSDESKQVSLATQFIYDAGHPIGELTWDDVARFLKALADALAKKEE